MLPYQNLSTWVHARPSLYPSLALRLYPTLSDSIHLIRWSRILQCCIVPCSAAAFQFWNKAKMIKNHPPRTNQDVNSLLLLVHIHLEQIGPLGTFLWSPRCTIYWYILLCTLLILRKAPPKKSCTSHLLTLWVGTYRCAGTIEEIMNEGCFEGCFKRSFFFCQVFTMLLACLAFFCCWPFFA